MKARYGSSPLAVAALDKDVAQLRMLASEIAANDLQPQVRLTRGVCGQTTCVTVRSVAGGAVDS